MGSFTEAFNLFWFTKQTGKAVSTAEREARSQDHKFIRCELDGYIPEEKANMECKHVSAFGQAGRNPGALLLAVPAPELRHRGGSHLSIRPVRKFQMGVHPDPQVTKHQLTT